MTDFPWLTVLGLLPLVGAVVIMLLPQGNDEQVKQVALGFAVVVLVGVAVMATQFQAAGARFQFNQKLDWIPQFGISYSVGVDGIALVLIALSAVLVPLVILAGWNDAEPTGRSVKGYFALMLSLETFMIGVFAATDLFLFYVFFEAMLIPVYFLIGRYGGPRASYAAVKFLIYSLAGGLFMLAALIGVYVVGARQLGKGTFDVVALQGLNMDVATGRMLFLGFFIAFAIKAPLVPVHTWLPDAAGQSTPGTAVLLVGVLDKVGTFGMLRYCLPFFPEASRYFAPAVVGIAVVGILYGALLAIGQTDMKRLIAYTSVSHFGFITIGIFALTTYGSSGSGFYMVSHGLSTAALFLVVGMMVSRRGSSVIADFGGVQKVAPLLAGFLLLAGLSGLALPGLSSFVGEFLTLVGAFTVYPVPAVIATVGIILAALYILIMYQKTMTGPVQEQVSHFADLRGREVLALVPLVALMIVLGVYPKPILDVVNPAIAQTLQLVGVTDPAPTSPGPATAEGINP